MNKWTFVLDAAKLRKMEDPELDKNMSLCKDESKALFFDFMGYVEDMAGTCATVVFLDLKRLVRRLAGLVNKGVCFWGERRFNAVRGAYLEAYWRYELCNVIASFLKERRKETGASDA